MLNNNTCHCMHMGNIIIYSHIASAPHIMQCISYFLFTMQWLEEEFLGYLQKWKKSVDDKRRLIK